MISAKYLALSSILFALAPATVLAGGNSSGGGDSLAAHFGATAERVASLLSGICKEETTHQYPVICAKAPQFYEAVTRTQVLPRESVTGPDGQPREATNDGVSTIELDIHAWSASLEDSAHHEAALRLNAHEYAQIAHLERSDTYSFSSQLLRILKTQNAEPMILLDVLPSVRDIEESLPTGIPPKPFSAEQIKPAIAAGCLEATPGDLKSASECTRKRVQESLKVLNLLRECALDGFPCKGRMVDDLALYSYSMDCVSWSGRDSVLPPLTCDLYADYLNPFTLPLYSSAAGKKLTKIKCAERFLARNSCWVE
jgi:hypothetical protein